MSSVHWRRGGAGMRPGTYVALVLPPVIGANRRACFLATTVTRSEPQRSSTVSLSQPVL